MVFFQSLFVPKMTLQQSTFVDLGNRTSIDSSNIQKVCQRLSLKNSCCFRELPDQQSSIKRPQVGRLIVDVDAVENSSPRRFYYQNTSRMFNVANNFSSEEAYNRFLGGSSYWYPGTMSAQRMFTQRSLVRLRIEDAFQKSRMTNAR